MEVKNAIANLKFYIDEDPYYNGTYKAVTDFEKYCLNHCQDIDTILSELDKKDKIINEMAYDLMHIGSIPYRINIFTKEQLIEEYTKKVEDK